MATLLDAYINDLKELLKTASAKIEQGRDASSETEEAEELLKQLMIDVRSLGGSERLHTEVCLRECKHQLEELKRNELLGNRRKSQGAQASQYDDEYRPPVVDERDERAVVAAHEEVAERSKGSLQRSLRALEQAEQVAQATSDKLQQQSTTMRGLHRKSRQVREDAVQAKRSANRMERWWTFW